MATPIARPVPMMPATRLATPSDLTKIASGRTLSKAVNERQCAIALILRVHAGYWEREEKLVSMPRRVDSYRAFSPPSS